MATGWLFPGQGAQAVGMGKGLYDAFPEAKELYRQANQSLGFDLTALCFDGPQEELTKTERCQLALFVTSLAGVAALRAKGVAAPAGMAGLSLGELTALCAADVFHFKDGLYLVQARSEAMAECAAKHPGAMLAVIGLSIEAVEDICRDADVVAANYNAADQLVLSGTGPGIQRAEELAKANGAKRAIKLEVSGAFHSPLMQPAADRFAAALKRVAFRAPKRPVFSNVTALAAGDPVEIQGLLVRQIVSPVLWEPTIRKMTQEGMTTFVELPPARVLTALLRRIEPSAKGTILNEPDDLQKLASSVPA